MAVLSWRNQGTHEERQLAAQTRLGRAPTNEIVISDSTVSWIHALILQSNGNWVLEDKRSANGCFVNGERRDRGILQDGDLIRLGNLEFTFRLVGSERASAFALGKEAVKGLSSHGGHSSVQLGSVTLAGILRDDPRVRQVNAISSVVAAPGQSDRQEDPRALTRKLRASYEISKATATTLDLPRVLDKILAALFEIFVTAERSFILLTDAKTGQVNAAAVKHRGAVSADEIDVPRTALEQAMSNSEAVLCKDALTDARYAQAQSVVNLRIRSMMIAPLVFQSQALGAIYVDTRSAAGQFTQSDLELLSVAATQAAACVSNVRIHEELVGSARLAAVGQTVAGLTHCIKNILQGVQGGSFILDKGLREGKLEGVRSGWEMVKRNNSFMEELVFDLLSYSKERKPEYEKADLNALCASVHEMVLARAQTKGVAMTFQPDPALESVEIDPKGIRRCVLNLATNAVDACAGNGAAVAIETRRPAEDGLVRILVRDTGCGISDDARAKLFTVFFSTKGSKGTGLGLPICKKIIGEHGGRIDVESQIGKGTTFTISLPPQRAPEVPERSGA